MTTRKRWMLAMGAVAVLAAFSVVLRQPRSGAAPGAAAGPAAPAGKGTSAPTARGASAAGLPRLAPARRTGRPGDAIVVERIRVAKTEVCRGEENLAELEVRTTDGTDPYLRIGLVDATATGPRLPFRLEAPVAPEEMPQVVIFGHGLAVKEARLPPVTVKDCQVPYQVTITPRLGPESFDDYTFEAEVKATSDDSAGFVPTRFIWDFGDGGTATTETARVEHSYRDRPQTSQYSFFMVRVRVEDGRQRTPVEGARTIEIGNLRFRPRNG
jgi:hypothetical protein